MSSGRIDLFCVGLVKYDNMVAKSAIISIISSWATSVVFPTSAGDVWPPDIDPLDNSFCTYSI